MARASTVVRLEFVLVHTRNTLQLYSHRLGVLDHDTTTVHLDCLTPTHVHRNLNCALQLGWRQEDCEQTSRKPYSMSE